MTNVRIMDTLNAYSRMFEASVAQSRPGGRNKYLEAIKTVTDYLNESAQSGDLEEGLAIIAGNLECDLEHLGRNPRSRSAIMQEMENIDRGMQHYRVLRDSPKAYRNILAPGFIRRDCMKNGTIPKDGMRKALTSHRNHILARHSPLLSEAEQGMVVAQTFLIHGTLERYTDRQCKILAE